MFGLDFLFLTALWALPLASMPVILHLLYRRKSPVVLFPTLQFVKSSMQQTAARRKIQRWLLLAIRMLLLLLLIWAVAQPARILASRFFSGSGNSLAIIVVDTSWSMQYRQNQVPLLTEADGIVQELLRGELRDASVLLQTSGDNQGGKFRSAADLLARWTPLKSEPAAGPLLERVVGAVETLKNQPPAQKLLIVISDFQAREFPRPLAELEDKDLRMVAIDLHPDRPRSAGITRITMDPPRPIAGVRSTVTVNVAGAAGDVRPVLLNVKSLDGKELLSRPPLMASFDATGHAQVRFDMEFPSPRWQVLAASLQGEDPMPWDDTRALVLEIPPQQRVTLLDTPEILRQPARVVKLALDPNEGHLADWPIKVQSRARISGDESTVVALLDKPPAAATVAQWNDVLSQGGTLVLMLRPGFETAFQGADQASKTALVNWLPSQPFVDETTEDRVWHAVPMAAGRSEPSMMGIFSDARNLATLQARRLVPMQLSDSRQTQILIGAAAGERPASNERYGLLYLRHVGAGRVFTWACVPDGMNTNLGTHPLFLPALVNECLRPLEVSGARNVDIGAVLEWEAPRLASQKELEIRTPADVPFRVPQRLTKLGQRAFIFGNATEPGIYRWYRVGDSAAQGVTNVTLPAEESEMSYSPAETVLPQDARVLVARSLPEMQGKVAQVSRPQPRWSLPLALVLVLLTIERLLSS